MKSSTRCLERLHQIGPVFKLPTKIKDIELAGCRIEWLNMSNSDTKRLLKNHMCVHLIFSRVRNIDGKLYVSAKLSRENGGPPKKVNGLGDEGALMSDCLSDSNIADLVFNE